jgi:DNA-binding NarL/FixJ family response regulator
VFIADDHQLILSAIANALHDAEDIEVVGVTHCGDRVPALVAEKLPDVVLLDRRMPRMDGIACLRHIAEHHPQIKVVMLSASENPAHVAEALEAGASAYIGKRINPRDLASAVRQIVAGAVHHAPPDTAAREVSADGQPDGHVSDLTQRELTMLEAITRGLSTKAISRELWIAEKTVKFHLTNIYRKLGVHNRTGAMRYAFEHGLIASAPHDNAVDAS